MKDRAKGVTRFRIHRTLSIVHVASMITTNILSSLIDDRPELKPYHRAAALCAFGSLLAATVTINL